MKKNKIQYCALCGNKADEGIATPFGKFVCHNCVFSIYSIMDTAIRSEASNGLFVQEIPNNSLIKEFVGGSCFNV